MRRAFSIIACVAVLLLATSATAWAAHPHGHGPGFKGPRPPVRNFQTWNHHHRWPAYRLGAVPPVIQPYPVYTTPVYPQVYPQWGFSLAGPNYSLWFGQ